LRTPRCSVCGERLRPRYIRPLLNEVGYWRAYLDTSLVFMHRYLPCKCPSWVNICSVPRDRRNPYSVAALTSLNVYLDWVHKIDASVAVRTQKLNKSYDSCFAWLVLILQTGLG
jgi:hypothetical protein